MKKTSQRARRVGDEIQRELADLLRNEVKDPRVGPVTITAVEVSLGPVARQGLLHAPRRARSTPPRRSRRCSTRPASCARELAHRLSLYSVPQLHFAYDDSIETGMRLSQLIDDAVAADQKFPHE